MASLDCVIKYLKLFSAAFPSKEISEQTIAVYCKYCDEIPDEQFGQACDDCIRKSRFFPTIAEIFEYAEPYMINIRHERKQKQLQENEDAMKKFLLFG